MGFPFIKGERIYLRAVDKDDVERCQRWLNDDEVTRTLITGRYPISRVMQEQWIEKVNSGSEANATMAICLNDNDVHIGNCGLHDIAAVDRHAELGIVIGERTQHNKGYASEAVALLLQYGFDKLNLHRIKLTVLDINSAAQRDYGKLGFVEEGRLRQNRYRAGGYVDELIMGILRDEWLEHRSGA